MLVMKFGGTSVKNADRIKAAAKLVVRENKKTAVITSAMSGVTDTLINLANLAKARETEKVETSIDALKQKHLDAAKEICADDHQLEKLELITGRLIDELSKLLHGVRLLQELSPRSLDLIQSFGERLAAPLLAAAVENAGKDAYPLDSREIIKTDNHFGSAVVDLKQSKELTRERLLDQVMDGVAVITGFIGSTYDGETTTLGRGGSDYSASLVGAFVDAEAIWIWTDVDGVMTADPRVVPEVRVLDEISYREAAEMSYFGSKVLHPSTMIPAVKQKIPIRICNSFNPDHPGTMISGKREKKFEGVKTVTSISNMALVTVEGKGMIGVPGVVKRVFSATAAVGVNVYMISQASSEQNISFIVKADQGELAKAELDREFELEIDRGRIDPINLKTPVGILAIIGEGMQGTPGISQRLFTALGVANINILAIAQGSSELNVSVVVDEEDLNRAVGAVHTRFGLSLTTHLFLLGKGLIGNTLIKQILAGRNRLAKAHGIELRVIGACGKDEFLFDPLGLGNERLEKIANGASLTDLGGEKRPSDDEILEKIADTKWLDVAIVDVTAADTGEFHNKCLQRGLHVVTANKKPMSGPLALYKSIRKEAFTKGLGYHFETTFGAGLPVLFTLQDLLATRDEIIEIAGCFSGTLGYICSGIEEGRPFSEVVLEAKKLGFTEPDPRDDLSGVDVARKALIIARETGMEIEMKDIELSGMVPDEFMAINDVDTFLQRLPELDNAIKDQVEKAAESNEVLRFMATITPKSVSVGLVSVDKMSAAGQLDGPDNILIYKTERYKDNPLVIRGPGAGAEVTAAGVFGDILKIARTS